MRLERQKKIEDNTRKKEQYKQKAIHDVIQLNEEAEIKLPLEISKYNDEKIQNTGKLINDISVQNATLGIFEKM